MWRQDSALHMPDRDEMNLALHLSLLAESLPWRALFSRTEATGGQAQPLQCDKVSKGLGVLQIMSGLATKR